MSTKAVNIAVVDGKKIIEATELQSAQPGKPIRIKAIPNGKYILAEGERGVASENITVKRVGKNLHISLEGTDPTQPEVIIEGFFDARGQLVGVAEDGAYYSYVSPDGSGDAAFLMDGVETPQVLGAEPLVGFGNGLYTDNDSGMGLFWPLLLGLGGLALLGGAYATGRKDGRDSVDKGDGNGGGHGGNNKPDTPNLDSVIDNIGVVTGQIENGGSTGDASPTFSGGGTPGNTIEIIVDDKVIGGVVVGEDGKWEFTPETPLTEGKHEIVLVEKDPKGNKSDPSEGFELIIHTTAPAKAAITSVTDDQGVQTGPISNASTMDDNQPLMAGTAEPGSTVIIYNNGREIGRAAVGASGNWSFTPTPPLPDGSYKITVAALDSAGNIGLPSDAFDFIVDTGAAEVRILKAVDDVGDITGDIAHGAITNDTTPTLHGKGTPGAVVNIYKDGVKIGATDVDANGNWTFTPDPELAEGVHHFSATVVTAANGESGHTDHFTLEIDTTAPGTPGEGSNGGIDNVHDDAGDKTGTIENGGFTDDTTPTLSGGGQKPGDIITIRDDANILGTAKVDIHGNWSFTPDPALPPGEHSITITVTDAAGNVSEPSDLYIVNIDTTAPDKAVITSVTDSEGPVTGLIGQGTTTDDTHPEFKGTAEPGSTVIISDNGREIGRAPVDGSGNWAFTPRLPLGTGHHNITVTAVDAAGNEGSPSDPFGFNVNTGGAPSAPAITGIIDNEGPITGNLEKGDITDDVRPIIHGTGQPGTTITVYSNGVELGTAPVGADGKWSLPSPRDLGEGLNNITAKATDAAGNDSSHTGEYPIIVDTARPDPATSQELYDNVSATGFIETGDTTDDNTPIFSGKAEPGTTVIIYNGTTEIGRAPVDAAGNWTFESPVLPDGNHKFHTVVEDKAGNKSDPGAVIDFNVDTSTVEVSIDKAVDNAGDIKGDLAHNKVTDDSTPTLHGKATPNTTVKIYKNGVFLESAPVDASGNWKLEVPDLGADGDYHFTATVVHPVDGESAPTDQFTLKLDTTAPGKPGEGGRGAIDNIHDDEPEGIGRVENGGHTNDTTPTLSGGGQASGDRVTIWDGINKLGYADVQADGTWSFTPSDPVLNPGKHDFTISVTDEAGNESERSDPYTIHIDVTAPAAPIIVDATDDKEPNTGSIGNGGSTNDVRPQINGTTEIGSKLYIMYGRNGDLWSAPIEVTVNPDGTWNWEPPVDLTDGEWEFKAYAVDAAGKKSPDSTEFDFIVDTVPPVAPESFNITGSDVTVVFDKTNVEPGDEVQIKIGDNWFKHELTADDIAAGKVTLNVPGATMDNVSVGIVDKVGNASDHTVAKGEFIEDFQDAELKELGSGTHDLGEFTVTLTAPSNAAQQGIIPGGVDYWGYTPPSGQKGLGMYGPAGQIIDLKGKSANVLGITIGNPHVVGVIEFFDDKGWRVHIATFRTNVGGADEYNISMPPGRTFSSFKFLNSGVDFLWLDNIAFCGGDFLGGFEQVPPPAQLDINSFGLHEGTSVGEEFTIDDVSVFNDAQTQLRGGDGKDTLTLTGQDQILNLTALGDKVRSMEVIDLTGSGDNTLKLSLDDVLANGEVDLFFDSENDATQMMVQGDEGDVVELQNLIDGEDPSEWTNQGPVTVAGVTYDVYRHSSLDAEILIQQGVTTNLA